eukprot:1704655-Prymnesium_polylepis.3
MTPSTFGGGPMPANESADAGTTSGFRCSSCGGAQRARARVRAAHGKAAGAAAAGGGTADARRKRGTSGVVVVVVRQRLEMPGRVRSEPLARASPATS